MNRTHGILLTAGALLAAGCAQVDPANGKPDATGTSPANQLQPAQLPNPTPPTPPPPPTIDPREATAARQYIDFLKSTHAVAIQSLGQINSSQFSDDGTGAEGFPERFRQEQIREQDALQSWRQFVSEFEHHPSPASCQTLALNYRTFLQSITAMFEGQAWSIALGISNPPDLTMERMRKFKRDIPTLHQRCIEAASITNTSLEEVCTRLQIQQTFKINAE